MRHKAEIDDLIAIAVLPVILFHAGFEWFSGGFVDFYKTLFIFTK